MYIYRAKTGYNGWIEYQEQNVKCNPTKYTRRPGYSLNLRMGKDGNFIRVRICGRVNILGCQQTREAKVARIQLDMLRIFPDAEQGEIALAYHEEDCFLQTPEEKRYKLLSEE